MVSGTPTVESIDLFLSGVPNVLGNYDDGLDSENNLHKVW